MVARDVFGRLICAGLFAFVAFSVFQNAGMTMGIMPITGIPLPFVSYGGTAVLVFFGAIGLALSVGARPVDTGDRPGTPRSGPPAGAARRLPGHGRRGRVIDLPSPYPAVTLVESEPPIRPLVFPVGLTEGTAMAQALRRMQSPRPMTHELFMQVLRRARVDVIAVRLTGREDGNLLAELDLMTPGGREASTAGPRTASSWRCACRSRRRSSSTSACSRTSATSPASRTRTRTWTRACPSRPSRLPKP